MTGFQHQKPDVRAITVGTFTPDVPVGKISRRKLLILSRTGGVGAGPTRNGVLSLQDKE